MDLEKMIESETPDSLKIAELIEERSEINDYKNELETRRKEIDKELNSFCNNNDIDKITYGKHTVVLVTRKGSVKWDRDALVRILSPMQIEKVFGEGSEVITTGKDSKYITVKTKRGNE